MTNPFSILFCNSFQLIKNMEKYKASLEKEFLNCGQSIRLLRLQEKDHRTKAKVEMKKLRSWHNQQIIRTYRNFLVAKLMKLKVQIELQDKRSLIINDSLKVPFFLAFRKALSPTYSISS